MFNWGAINNLVHACPINLGCTQTNYSCGGVGHVSRVCPFRFDLLFRGENAAVTISEINVTFNVQDTGRAELIASLRESCQPEVYVQLDWLVLFVLFNFYDYFLMIVFHVFCLFIIVILLCLLLPVNLFQSELYFLVAKYILWYLPLVIYIYFFVFFRCLLLSFCITRILHLIVFLYFYVYYFRVVFRIVHLLVCRYFDVDYFLLFRFTCLYPRVVRLCIPTNCSCLQSHLVFPARDRLDYFFHIFGRNFTNRGFFFP